MREGEGRRWRRPGMGVEVEGDGEEEAGILVGLFPRGFKKRKC